MYLIPAPAKLEKKEGRFIWAYDRYVTVDQSCSQLVTRQASLFCDGAEKELGYRPLLTRGAAKAGIRQGKFFGVGLDVYEEEGDNVFENREDELLQHSITARLLSFPNVIITSHQGFLTREALAAISRTTLQNAVDYENRTIHEANQVK